MPDITYRVNKIYLLKFIFEKRSLKVILPTEIIASIKSIVLRIFINVNGGIEKWL
jgi:hypothetical protein